MTDPDVPTERIPADELYRSEFALVSVTRVEDAGGPRLRVTDLASGEQVLLDPLELEALTRLRHRDFASLLDPSDAVGGAEPDPDQV